MQLLHIWEGIPVQISQQNQTRATAQGNGHSLPNWSQEHFSAAKIFPFAVEIIQMEDTLAFDQIVRILVLIPLLPVHRSNHSQYQLFQ